MNFNAKTHNKSECKKQNKMWMQKQNNCECKNKINVNPKTKYVWIRKQNDCEGKNKTNVNAKTNTILMQEKNMHECKKKCIRYKESTSIPKKWEGHIHQIWLHRRLLFGVYPINAGWQL